MECSSNFVLPIGADPVESSTYSRHGISLLTCHEVDHSLTGMIPPPPATKPITHQQSMSRDDIATPSKDSTFHHLSATTVETVR